MALHALFDVAAPAKLNLHLHVTGRRADGYHLLDTTMVLIDWCDTLNFESRADGQLRRHDLGPPLPADDLCLRAARALRATTNDARHGADISIDKRVPSGAGMGGGSSDAATTLLALNRLWGLGRSAAELARIGLALGADVPFFIFGENARARGVGEELRAVVIEPCAFAVAKAPTSLDTRSVFLRFASLRQNGADIVEGFAEAGLAGSGRNDLQAAAEAMSDDETGGGTGVQAVAVWLEGHFGNSRMTGSGSAVFSRIERDSPQAAVLPTLPEGWVGRICQSLAVHPLHGWATRQPSSG